MIRGDIMAILRLEIPDGHFCKGCSFLLQGNPRDGSMRECKIFNCILGNKLTDIFKCPMCIEQTENNKPAIKEG